MSWKKAMLQAFALTTLLLAIPALSSDNKVVVVNMMIDAELDPYSVDLDNENKIEIELSSLIMDILNEVDPLGLNVTIYLTGDYVNETEGDYDYRLSVSSISNHSNHEMALSGMKTDENLGNMSYNEQHSRIFTAKSLIEQARICSGKDVDVKGFRPQGFSQNNDTHKILDRWDFTYDAGYISGMIYVPGHENDAWPYPIGDNYSFYAVPVSSHQLTTNITLISNQDQFSQMDVAGGSVVDLSKGLVPMEDRYAKENGLSGKQWGELLIREFEECSREGEPMVVIFHNFVIGADDEYLKAYRDFVNHAKGENATFVTTQQLVDMSISGLNKD